MTRRSHSTSAACPAGQGLLLGLPWLSRRSSAFIWGRVTRRRPHRHPAHRRHRRADQAMRRHCRSRQSLTQQALGHYGDPINPQGDQHDSPSAFVRFNTKWTTEQNLNNDLCQAVVARHGISTWPNRPGSGHPEESVGMGTSPPRRKRRWPASDAAGRSAAAWGYLQIVIYWSTPAT